MLPTGGVLSILKKASSAAEKAFLSFNSITVKKGFAIIYINPIFVTINAVANSKNSAIGLVITQFVENLVYDGLFLKRMFILGYHFVNIFCFYTYPHSILRPIISITRRYDSYVLFKT